MSGTLKFMQAFTGKITLTEHITLTTPAELVRRVNYLLRNTPGLIANKHQVSFIYDDSDTIRGIIKPWPWKSVRQRDVMFLFSEEDKQTRNFNA